MNYDERLKLTYGHMLITQYNIDPTFLMWDVVGYSTTTLGNNKISQIKINFQHISIAAE